MANLTLTIPDGVVSRVQAAFGPPGTPATNAEIKARLVEYIKTTVRNREGDDARTAAFADVDADISIS